MEHFSEKVLLIDINLSPLLFSRGEGGDPVPQRYNIRKCLRQKSKLFLYKEVSELEHFYAGWRPRAIYYREAPEVGYWFVTDTLEQM